MDILSTTDGRTDGSIKIQEEFKNGGMEEFIYTTQNKAHSNIQGRIGCEESLHDKSRVCGDVTATGTTESKEVDHLSYPLRSRPIEIHQISFGDKGSYKRPDPGFVFLALSGADS